MKTKNFWGIVPQVITLLCLIFLAINSVHQKKEIEALKKENFELKSNFSIVITKDGVYKYNDFSKAYKAKGTIITGSGIYTNGKFTPFNHDSEFTPFE